MIMYRVQFKRRAADDWQSRAAATRTEAQRIQRSYLNRFWIAVVQVWHEQEQCWVG